MSESADTTRDVVAAAYKDAVARAEPAPEPAAESAPEPADTPEPSAETKEEAKEAEKTAARDGKGRFIVPPKQKPAALEKPPAPTEQAGQDGAAALQAVAAPPAPKQTADALKPPQDWRLSAREKWAALPREVQEEALRLHVETKKSLSEMAELRKGHESFTKTIAPYETMIRAEGIEPAQAVGILLQREAALRTAPMPVRAQILAYGIKQFLGTDENAINLLAQALQGQPGQPGGAQSQAPIDPRQLIAQAKQEFVREFEQRQAAQIGQAAQSEVETFAQSHEFLEDVDPETGWTLREEMANILEADARAHPEKPTSMPFEQAYKLACKRHSEVSKVIAQREAAKAATAKAATTQAARSASSSIKNEPAGPASNGKPKNDRELVAQAYYAQKNAR